MIIFTNYYFIHCFLFTNPYIITIVIYYLDDYWLPLSTTDDQVRLHPYYSSISVYHIIDTHHSFDNYIYMYQDVYPPIINCQYYHQ